MYILIDPMIEMLYRQHLPKYINNKILSILRQISLFKQTFQVLQKCCFQQRELIASQYHMLSKHIYILLTQTLQKKSIIAIKVSIYLHSFITQIKCKFCNKIFIYMVLYLDSFSDKHTTPVKGSIKTEIRNNK